MRPRRRGRCDQERPWLVAADCSSRTNPVAQPTLMARSALSLQQNFRDRVPFGAQRRGRDRTLRLPVPITRIAEIALHAMQIGMDPGTILAALIHDDGVRLLPLVLARPPKRGQRRCEA